MKTQREGGKSFHTLEIISALYGGSIIPFPLLTAGISLHSSQAVSDWRRTGSKQLQIPSQTKGLPRFVL